MHLHVYIPIYIPFLSHVLLSEHPRLSIKLHFSHGTWAWVLGRWEWHFENVVLKKKKHHNTDVCLNDSSGGGRQGVRQGVWDAIMGEACLVHWFLLKWGDLLGREHIPLYSVGSRGRGSGTRGFLFSSFFPHPICCTYPYRFNWQLLILTYISSYAYKKQFFLSSILVPYTERMGQDWIG